MDHKLNMSQQHHATEKKKKREKHHTEVKKIENQSAELAGSSLYPTELWPNFNWGIALHAADKEDFQLLGQESSGN